LLKVKEVAQLVGISVRTLHYYDEIGLLRPEATSQAGYRLYSERNLERLQQILFFKNIGFSLKQIKQIIDDPDFNQLEALQLHRQILLEKRANIDTLIQTVDKTIQHTKGAIQMGAKERFAGFDFSKNEYEQEARERWGDKAIDDSQKKINKMADEERKGFEKQFEQIFRELADIRHLEPKSDQVQTKIGEWYAFLNRMGKYSPEVFANLGEMYVSDERFTKNIDQFGEGLAIFMRDAMKVYAKERK